MNMTEILANLVTVLGIEDMPEEEQTELISMMGETVIQNSLARFADTSDEAVVSDINQKIESMELPEFLAYVDEQYPDFGYIMNDEMRFFLKELDEMETQG